MADPAATADLIAFLQALPEGRKRRGVRYPQWLLLLMAILGILSGCRSARDLERFAKRHHRAFAAALELELPKAPCDSTFLYLFERVELEQLFGLLREWMLAQLADQDLTDGHKCETPCYRTGLMPLGGQGAMRAWGCDTKPIPRGFPRPAPC